MGLHGLYIFYCSVYLDNVRAMFGPEVAQYNRDVILFWSGFRSP